MATSGKGLLTRAGLLGFAALGLLACTEDARRPVATTVVQPSCDTSFRVVNQSSLTVAQLFFSHSNLGAWGNDQLGASVLPPGRFANYRAANTGSYDFRVVWQNGRSAELRRVNICAASQIIVTNNGLQAI
jgi:hypothetical protein